MRAATVPMWIHRKPLSGISILPAKISLVNNSKKELISYFQHVLLKKFTIFLKFKFLKKLRYGIFFF